MIEMLWTSVPSFFQWLRDMSFYDGMSVMSLLVAVLLIGLLIHIVTPFNDWGD